MPPRRAWSRGSPRWGSPRCATGARSSPGAQVDDSHEEEALGAARGVRARPVAPEPDLADVLGQPEAVAALEVAAVGGHHVSMVGRPGVGKTLLAERLPTILPDLADDDALTVTAIRSVVSDVRGLVRRPPFQSPHHTATVAGPRRRGTRRPADPGRRDTGPRRSPVPGRGRRVRLRLPGVPAPAPGVRRGEHRAGGLHGPDARAVPAGHGSQPLPLRAWATGPARSAAVDRRTGAATAPSSRVR